LNQTQGNPIAGFLARGVFSGVFHTLAKVSLHD
jgi:hypothetical protein